MRVLYLPLLTAADLQVCSTVQAVKGVLFDFVDTYPNSTVHVMIPKKMRNKEELSHPKVEIIETEIWRQRQQFEMRYVNPEVARFWDDGTDFLDIVLTDKLPAMGYLKGNLAGLTGCTGGQTEKLHISMLQFVLTKKHHGYVDEHILQAQSEGFTHSDMILYSCESQLKRLSKQAIAFVPPAKIMKAQERSLKLLPVGHFPEIGEIKKEKSPIIMNYTLGMCGTYNVEELFEIMDKVYCGGRDVHLQINTPSESTVWEETHKIPKKYSHATWTRNLPYDEWLDWLRKGHVFMYDAEGGGDVSASVLTQQLFRQIGVFKKGRYWLEDYVFEGYPFTYKTVKEAQTILRYVIDEYFSDEVQEVIDKQVAFVEAEYFPQCDTSILIDSIARALVAKKQRTKNCIAYRVLKEFVGEKHLISWKELVKFVKEKSEKDLTIARATGRYGRSPGVWRDAMLLLGYADIGGEGGTLFQKYGDSIEDLYEMKML